MRRLLLALTLLLVPSLAWGQCTGVFPASSVCGNTAVTPGVPAAVALSSFPGLFANPTASVGLATVNGTALTAMRSDGAPALSQAIAPTWTQPHIFQPSSGSYAIGVVTTNTTPGFYVSQTGPASGGPAAGWQYNTFNIASDNGDAGSGPTSAVYINYFFGGSNLKGARQGLGINTTFTATSSATNSNLNYVALQGNQNVAANDGGTNTGAGARGSFFGMNPGVQTIVAGATNLAAVVGVEADVSMIAGSTTRDLLGFSAVKLTGTGAAGARNDAAFQVGTATGVTPWTNGFWVCRTCNGGPPIATTGTVMGSDSAVSGGAAMTMGSLIDFHLDTFSNDYLYLKNFRLTGAGVISASGYGSGTLISTAGAITSLAGTTTTVLHGNAAGAPSFGAVVSADLNITSTTCTNQFLTAISSAAAGTCTTATLAGAQFANQGSTTTVLHGNAAGNPSWSAISLTADVTGTLPVANGGTNYTGVAWTGYTSTAGTNSGSITTQSSNSTYIQIGKIVFVNAQVTITNHGTAAGTVTLTLPVAAKTTNMFCAGREAGVTGKMFSGILTSGSATVNVLYYDNTTPTWADGLIFNLNCSYEAN